MTWVAQSCSGLFSGAGSRPRLPSDAVPSRMRVPLRAHRRDHPVEAVELDVEHRAHQLGGAGAVAGERLHRVVAALPVEVAGIDGAARPLGDRVVVDGDAAALAAGHVLVVIEAEAADVADAAELAALVAAADALAGILDDDQVVRARRSP